MVGERVHDGGGRFFSVAKGEGANFSGAEYHYSAA